MLELVAVRVDAPRWSSSGASPASADRRVGQAVAPGPAERVVTTTATSTPRRSAQRGAQRAGGRVRSPSGSSTTVPGATLLASTPAGGQDEAVPGLDDPRGRRAARRPGRSRRRSPPRGRRPRTTRPSALLTTLRVTTTTSPSRSGGRQRGDQRGEVVAGARPRGSPSDAADLERGQPRRSAIAARRGRGRPGPSPAVGGEVGHEQRHGPADRRPPRQRRPRRRRPRRPASRRAARQPPRRRSAGRPPSAEVSTPIAARQASAMPRTGAPPMIGDTPDDRCGGRRDRVRGCRAPPGSCRWRRPGCDGGSSTTSALGDGVEHARPGCGVLDADRRRSRGPGPRRAAAPTTPGSARPAAAGACRRSITTGSRPGRRSSAAAGRRARQRRRTAPR